MPYTMEYYKSLEGTDWRTRGEACKHTDKQTDQQTHQYQDSAWPKGQGQVKTWRGRLCRWQILHRLPRLFFCKKMYINFKTSYEGHATGDTWHVKHNTWHVGRGEPTLKKISFLAFRLCELQVTCGTLYVTPGTWHLKCDMWDKWHMMGVEPSLNI